MKKIIVISSLIMSSHLHAACSGSSPENTENADPSIVQVVLGEAPNDPKSASVSLEVPTNYNGAEVENIQINRPEGNGSFVYQLPLSTNTGPNGKTKAEFLMAYTEISKVEVSVEYSCKGSKYLRYLVTKKLEHNKSLKDAP